MFTPLNGGGKSSYLIILAQHPRKPVQYWKNLPLTYNVNLPATLLNEFNSVKEIAVPSCQMKHVSSGDGAAVGRLSSVMVHYVWAESLCLVSRGIHLLPQVTPLRE